MRVDDKVKLVNVILFVWETLDADIVAHIAVVSSIIRLLLLFSGFKNRSLSRRERNHPRNLEMVTLMMSVHPWMSAKIRVVDGNNVGDRNTSMRRTGNVAL